MILDRVLTYHQKVIIAVIVAGFWIYFRNQDCYAMIPRMHLLPVLFVMAWTYLNYYDPLFLPIGLLILVSSTHKIKTYAKGFFRPI